MAETNTYVTREAPSSNYSDMGIIVEGLVVLRDLENEPLAIAMLFGLFYALNMRYPSKLPYTHRVYSKGTD